MMHFYAIRRYKEEPESNIVVAQCDQCDDVHFITFDKCEEIVDGEYVKLKDGNVRTCKGCGAKSKNIITYGEQVVLTPSPHCPACGSSNLQRISLTSKVAAAATVGVFAIGHTSKTFKCLNCKYKF